MVVTDLFVLIFFRDAMSLNLKGTQNIIKLCRGMKHLEVGILTKRKEAYCIYLNKRRGAY